jgi:hypothetical protein
LADQGWDYGSLLTPPTPNEPPGLDDGSAARLLDEAEDIINSVGPQVLAEVEAQRAKEARGNRFTRLFRRKR